MADLDTTMKIVDHIEIDHERELAPAVSTSQIRRMHELMHISRGDWDHVHRGERIVFTNKDEGK